MSLSADHIEKYQHNRSFINERVFETTKYDDWKIVAMFYEAVHIVEAYFVMNGKGSTSHMDREKRIEQDPLLKPIRTAYYDLLSMSKAFRYKCTAPSNAEVMNAQEDLQSIRKTIEPLIEEGHK